MRSIWTDTFRLGGSADATFDVSLLSAGTFPTPSSTYNRFEFFQKVGTSTWTLTGVTAGTNTVTSWEILEGALSVSSDAKFGAAAGTLTIDGGTLQTTGAFTSARAVTIGANNGTIETLADLVFSGVISGPGSLIKTGASTLTLTGSETYTGETLIQDGTLAITEGSGLAQSSRVVANGAFNISGVTGSGAAIRRLAGSGLVNLGAKTLVLTNANDLFSGTITGTGGLRLNAYGTQTLSGPNNYTGQTQLGFGASAAGSSGPA